MLTLFADANLLITGVSAAITAAATVSLVVVTVVYVRKTADISESSHRSAKASEHAAVASQRAVQVAERATLLAETPLVVGVSTSRHNGIWSIELRNRGGGTALNIETWVDVDGSRWVSRTEEPATNRAGARDRLSSLSKGDSEQAHVEGPVLAEDHQDVAIVVQYLDKAGDRYGTTNYIYGSQRGTLEHRRPYLT